MAGTGPRDLTAFLSDLADEAGVIVRRHFRTDLEVEPKADLSPVTMADREVERRLRALIEAAFPEDGIIGEEFGAVRAEASRIWWLDPIDGTKAFITGRPLFGTLVALVDGGRPVLGMIDQCIVGDRWLGIAGGATTLNGKPVQTRPCASLDQATLSVTNLQMFETPASRAAYDRIEARVALPTYGGDCYAYGLLAAGFIDLIVEAGLEPYDYLALIPVIEGAGGCATDWEGRPLGPDSDGKVVMAGDPRLHAQALDLLANR